MGSVVTLDNGTNQERSLVHLGDHKRPTQLPNHTSKRTLTTSLDGRSWTRCPWLIWGHPGVSPIAGYATELVAVRQSLVRQPFAIFEQRADLAVGESKY
jgi:hypothetical protein